MTVTDSGAAIKPRIPACKKEGTYEPPSPAVLNGAVASSPDPAIPIKIRSIEDAPQRVTSSTALIGAMGKVYAAATARIAELERELAQIREAIKPFATLA